jgi:hypothetical protein
VLEDSLKLGKYLISLLTARKQMWEPDFAGDTLRIFVSGMPILVLVNGKLSWRN